MGNALLQLKRSVAGLILASAVTLPAWAQVSSYGQVNVAGSFNGFETLAPNMFLAEDNIWQADLTITNKSFFFKFATPGFAQNWGINSQPHRTLPQAMTGISSGGDINVTNASDNTLFRFLFNDQTREYAVFLVNQIDSNLLFNTSFESTGNTATRARYWEFGNPNSHGGIAGSAQRQGVSWGITARSGNWVGLIAGTWSGTDTGTWWQDAPAEPGLVYEAAAWFQAEGTNSGAPWATAQLQQIKLEFYDFNRTNLLGTFVRSLTSVTTNWAEQAIAGLAPENTAWARLVFHVEGAGSSGTLRIDDASLRATTAKRTEDFNKWLGATVDDCYSRSGWTLCAGKTVVSYTNASQVIPLSRSGFAASLNNPTVSNEGSYVRSPRFNDGAGTVTFYYRHGYQGDPAENPDTPVHFKVQRSFVGDFWTTIADVSNVVNTTYQRFDVFNSEPNTRFIRIVHGGGSTNRLLIDDIFIDSANVQPRLMTFNTWSNATASGDHFHLGWRLSNGLVSAASALDGLAGQISGSTNNINFLQSPTFTNGYGTISFSYALGGNSTRTAGFSLESSTNGVNWSVLHTVSNISSASMQTYNRFFIQSTPHTIRIRNLSETNIAPNVGTGINEPFNDAPNPPPGWTFNQIGAYTGVGGVAPPALRMDVTGASVTTPNVNNPTNLKFTTQGQSINAESTLTVEGVVGGVWQTITVLTNLTGSEIIRNYSISTNITQVRFTFTKVATGNLALDDVIIQITPPPGSPPPQNLALENVSIGIPAEFRTQDFNSWPTKPFFDSGTDFYQGWVLDGPISVTSEKARSGQAAILTRAAAGSGNSGSDYVVNFEGAGETKTGYASGTVSLSGVNWDLTEALIGTSEPDWKNGARSLRMRGFGASAMTMLVNRTNGLGSIGFSYRQYSSDPQTTWQVQYSTNNGSSWVNIGSTFTGTATVQTFSQPVNIQGNIRVRIKENTGSGSSNRRLNIDDIVMTDYSTGGGGGDLVNSVINSHFLPSGIGPVSFYYRHYQDSTPSGNSIMTAMIQTSSNGTHWVNAATQMIANTSYALFEKYLNLTNHYYFRIHITNGTGKAIIDDIVLLPPQPPANVSISTYYEPPAPFTNDAVTVFANVTPSFGARELTVTSYYRIGTSGSFTGVAMTAVGGSVYQTPAFPPLPAGTIVQYYIEAMYQGPGAELTRPARYPTNAPVSLAFFSIPRNPPGLVWINEIDYEAYNFDEDSDKEFIELAGVAGIDISGWTIEIVTGITNPPAQFGSYIIATNTVIANDTNGFGFFLLAMPDMTNPVPDMVITSAFPISMSGQKPGGIRLLNEVGGVEHAVSFGGFVPGFVRITPTDDDFFFDLTNTIALTGTGFYEGQFAWTNSAPPTPGAANPGQNFADPALISASPTVLTFSYIPESFNPPTKTFVISNAGVSVLSYDIAATPSWISVNPTFATNLTAGQTQLHTVTIDTTGLTGNRSGFITISGTAVNSPVSIQVQANETTLGSALVRYTFDEGGLVAANNLGSVGNVANLFLTNGAIRTLEAEGVSGKLGDYGFTSTSVTAMARSTGTVAALNNQTQFTLTGWIRPTGAPGEHLLIGNGGTNQGFALLTSGNYAELSLVSSSTGRAEAVSSTNNIMVSSDWTFFAITYDSTNTTSDAVRFYVGSPANSISLNSALPRGSLSATGTNAAPLKVGGNGTNSFNGIIDDIRMFAGVLDTMSMEAARREGAIRLTGSGEMPSIEEHPASTNLTIGQPITLNVVASGIPLPQYQWRRFGTNINNATLSSFTISTPVAEDAGSYDVVVFNAYGAVTSINAVLTLEGNIAIITQPASLSAYPGDTVQFSVLVTSTNPVYQWNKNSTNLVGATNALLTITNITTNSQGGYQVVASDLTGSVTSFVATLTVIDLEFDGSGGGMRIAGTNVVISWPSIANRTYDLLWSSNIMNGTHSFSLIATNLPATPTVNVYTDAIHHAEQKGYYRVNSRQVISP